MRQAEEEWRRKYKERRQPLRQALLEWEEVLASLRSGKGLGGSQQEQLNALLDKGWEVVEQAPLLATKSLLEKLVALTKQAVELKAENETTEADGLVGGETWEASKKDLAELGEQLRQVVGSSLALPLARL